MQIRIPTKIAGFLSQRILSILCVFLVLVSFLVVTVGKSQTQSQEPPSIPMVYASGADIARLHAEKREFLCHETYLYVIIDDKIFGLVDSFGDQIICKTI